MHEIGAKKWNFSQINQARRYYLPLRHYWHFLKENSKINGIPKELPHKKQCKDERSEVNDVIVCYIALLTKLEVKFDQCDIGWCHMDQKLAQFIGQLSTQLCVDKQL